MSLGIEITIKFNIQNINKSIKLKNKNTPKRILFHYMLGVPTGGSDHSLYNHIANLDKSKFTPIVIFNQESYHKDLLEKQHIETLLIPLSKKIGINNKKNVINGATKSKKKNFIFEFLKKTIGREIKAISSSLPEVFILLKIFKKKKIDLIHTNFNLSASRPAIIAASISMTPIVVHNRGLSNLLKIDKLLSFFANKIICISEYVKTEYLLFGINERKCQVVFNGVDVSKFSPQNKMNNEKNVIVSIGRLEKWKGQHIIINSVNELLNYDKEIEIWIIGSGAEFEPLQNLIIEKKLENNVKLLGQKSNINKYLDQATVFIHSSIEPEPFGRVIIEAMANGIPVIATNIGGPKEIISNNYDGILIKPSSAEELANSITNLLKDKTKSKEIAINARKTVLEKFAIERTTTEIEKIYEEFL